MAYLALYRKFRPKGFDGLVGQEHIVKTLVNQIETDKIGHAYATVGTIMHGEQFRGVRASEAVQH